MSLQCHECAYCEDVPNSAVCNCTKKNIGMLEPLEFLYMGCPTCDDFIQREGVRPFLDCNHRIPNISDHHIPLIAFDPYPYPPKFNAKSMQQWEDTILRDVARIIETYNHSITQLYGHRASVNRICTDVTQKIENMVRPSFRVNYRYYKPDEEKRCFVLKAVNLYLRSIQRQALLSIFDPER